MHTHVCTHTSASVPTHTSTSILHHTLRNTHAISHIVPSIFSSLSTHSHNALLHTHIKAPTQSCAHTSTFTQHGHPHTLWCSFTHSRSKIHTELHASLAHMHVFRLLFSCSYMRIPSSHFQNSSSFDKIQLFHLAHKLANLLLHPPPYSITRLK